MEALIAVGIGITLVQLCAVVYMWLAVRRMENTCKNYADIVEDLLIELDDPCYDTIEEPFDAGEDDE